MLNSSLTTLMLDSPAVLIGVAFLLDLLFGDPVYRWHPVRLIGQAIARLEATLRARQEAGFRGGIVLTLGVVSGTLLAVLSAVAFFSALHPLLGWGLSLYWAWSFLALRDLLGHAWAVRQALAEEDLQGARQAVSQMVGRDTQALDAGACGRAAVESVAENLCDGVIAPLFWFALLGLPGMVLFKVVNTLDSMVGYRTEQYRQFGWASARLDDVLCWLPARLTFGLLVAGAWLLPGYSASQAWRIGLRDRHHTASPNAGWSEAAAAGALNVRLRGPIWRSGHLSSDDWIGPQTASEAVGPDTLTRMNRLAFAASLLALLLLLGGLP